MQKPAIVKFEVEDQTDATGKLFTFTLRCPSCLGTYPFIFTAGAADIRAHYMAEDIARTYVERCAPSKCAKCL